MSPGCDLTHPSACTSCQLRTGSGAWADPGWILGTGTTGMPATPAGVLLVVRQPLVSARPSSFTEGWKCCYPSCFCSSLFAHWLGYTWSFVFWLGSFPHALATFLDKSEHTTHSFLYLPLHWTTANHGAGYRELLLVLLTAAQLMRPDPEQWAPEGFSVFCSVLGFFICHSKFNGS